MELIIYYSVKQQETDMHIFNSQIFLKINENKMSRFEVSAPSVQRSASVTCFKTKLLNNGSKIFKFWDFHYWF